MKKAFCITENIQVNLTRCIMSVAGYRLQNGCSQWRLVIYNSIHCAVAGSVGVDSRPFFTWSESLGCGDLFSVHRKSTKILKVFLKAEWLSYSMSFSICLFHLVQWLLSFCSICMNLKVFLYKHTHNSICIFCVMSDSEFTG